MFIIVLERLFLEAFLDFFYFPLWWYTGGLKYAAGKFLERLKIGNGLLAPGIWMRNILVPMFGQYDWQGRIISFLMRLVQIIFRLAALLIWSAVCFALLFLWLAWPVIIVYGFIYAFS